MPLNRRETPRATAAGSLPRSVHACCNETENWRRREDVVVVVCLSVKPGCEQEFLDLLEPVLDAMRQEATFINAVLHRDPEDPARFMIYETWGDLADLTEVQVHREYRKAYLNRLPHLLREPRGIQLWSPMRGDLTCARASRADLGDGPDRC